MRMNEERRAANPAFLVIEGGLLEPRDKEPIVTEGTRVLDAPLERIEVPENRLRELRDYSGLAASMREIGLLQPITVTEAWRLVAGRHRLEAARSLGWKTIQAVVVEEDELRNRLAEIDENLQRFDLTVWEQSKHAKERERVLEAMGQRAKGGAGRKNTAAAAGFSSTAEVAKEAGMSERSWQNRTKIGKALGPETAAILDQADPTEEKHRNILNSTTQLNHLADISNKRGDGVAAEVAERVFTRDGASTFKVYDAMKEERGEVSSSPFVNPKRPETAPKFERPERPDAPTVRDTLASTSGKGLDLPDFDLPEERRVYRKIIQNLDAITKLDNERIVGFCKGLDEAEREIEYLDELVSELTDLRTRFANKKREWGNLRAVN